MYGLFIRHINLSDTTIKVPHAFQQRLSAEKTLTLCDALPSFSAFILQWRSLQEKMPEMKDVIQASLKKLEDYFLKVMDIPAYNFAMSKFHFQLSSYSNISRNLKSENETMLV